MHTTLPATRALRIAIVTGRRPGRLHDAVAHWVLEVGREAPFVPNPRRAADLRALLEHVISCARGRKTVRDATDRERDAPRRIGMRRADDVRPVRHRLRAEQEPHRHFSAAAVSANRKRP